MTCPSCMVALSGLDGPFDVSDGSLGCKLLSAGAGGAVGAAIGAMVWKAHRGQGAGIGLAAGGLIGGIVGMLLCKPRLFSPDGPLIVAPPAIVGDVGPAAPGMPTPKPFSPSVPIKVLGPGMSSGPSVTKPAIAPIALRSGMLQKVNVSATQPAPCGMHQARGPDGVCREVLY